MSESAPNLGYISHNNPGTCILSCDTVSAKVGAFELGPVSLMIMSGETCCLLGPNGSGKTTLLRRLLGTLPGGARSIVVAGKSAIQRQPGWLRFVGVVPDDPTELLEELTAAEYWELASSTYSSSRRARSDMMVRAHLLADRLQLEPPRHALISTYSHGMRKKTQLIAALLHQPKLLIVDEPRNGLDPAGIATMETLLAEQCSAGGAVLAATHDLYWADRIASRVAILSKGKVVLNESKARLSASGVDLPELFFRVTQDLSASQRPNEQV